MVRRLNRILQLVRDVFVLVISVAIIGSSWGKWVEEPVFLILDSLSAVFVVLSVINIALIVRKVKRRGFFIGNAVYQLIPGFLFAGLLLPLGIIILVLNIAVLATIGVKKTPEELLKHPPIPRTRNYRVTAGIGTLVMLVSLFVPWLSSAGSTTSLIGLYSAIVNHSDLPNLSISQTNVVFALLTLILSPASLICGALAQLRRRFSLVAGILAIISGVSLFIVVGASTGPGAYGFIAGGAVVAAAFFAFRRA